MAYQLTDINRRALSDPAEFLRDSDKRYEAKLEELYRAAQTILRNNHDFLLAVQKALLGRETLFGSDIAAIRYCQKEFVIV